MAHLIAEFVGVTVITVVCFAYVLACVAGVIEP